jgi:hypothetical protein
MISIADFGTVTNDHASSSASICRIHVNRLAAKHLHALLQPEAPQQALPIAHGFILIDAYGGFAGLWLSHCRDAQHCSVRPILPNSSVVITPRVTAELPIRPT